MTHINLDTQPEVVRQFVLTLSASGDGAVLELSGRPVACVVPPPKLTTTSVPAGEWTEESKRRTGALVDRKYDGGINAAEEAELVMLQNEMHCYIDQVAPLPLDAVRRLHQELLQKAAHAPNANPA